MGLVKDVLFFISGGDDGYLDNLKALYAGCNNIIFTSHYLSAEKLINMYSAGDIFAFPSLHEAFGIVLLEATAQGLPVISTNVGGPSEFVTPDFGYLINPEDQDLWVKYIQEMLNNRQKLKKMSENAKIFSLGYNWKKQIIKIIKAYSWKKY